MRLIDADAFKEYMRNSLEATKNCYPDKGEWAKVITEEFCKDIDEQPTIAQPETIRCRDCKHYKRYKYTGDFACHYVIGGTVRREPDDFCSRAERTELADELVKEADHGTD